MKQKLQFLLLVVVLLEPLARILAEHEVSGKDAQYKYLEQILKNFSRYDRPGAVLALAKAATDETLKNMVRDSKENKDPAVRQGMADAPAKMNDEYRSHLGDDARSEKPRNKEGDSSGQ